jgi:hypothetical protein
VTVYLFVSDTPEHADLAEGFGRFTDVRPSRPPLSPRQIVLVSFDGVCLNAVGRMKRGGKAANYKWHVTLDELVFVDEPPLLDELANASGKGTADAIVGARLPPGGQLRDSTAEEFLQSVIKLRPELAQDIEHLRAISRPERRRPAPPDREPIVEYERDAVGLALEMSGMSHERTALLSAWDGRSDEPFLRNIPQYAVLEDRAIEHDARVFGDWQAIKTGVIGATRFESRGRRMTVINANRAGIEHAIGVDLIYYSQNYNAYTVVQYKRREPGSGERWRFRPDGNFDDELRRMRKLIRADADAQQPYEYRLDDRCCFLKLCAPTTPDAFSSDLVNGVYLPLAYWDVLEGSGAATGPKGGRLLTDKSVGRYLTNTLFIDLVKAAWIGSRAATSDVIEAVVAEGLASNRSLILASSSADERRTMSLDGDEPDDLPF